MQKTPCINNALTEVRGRTNIGWQLCVLRIHMKISFLWTQWWRPYAKGSINSNEMYVHPSYRIMFNLHCITLTKCLKGSKVNILIANGKDQFIMCTYHGHIKRVKSWEPLILRQPLIAESTVWPGLTGVKSSGSILGIVILYAIFIPFTPPSQDTHPNAPHNQQKLTIEQFVYPSMMPLYLPTPLTLHPHGPSIPPSKLG